MSTNSHPEETEGEGIPRVPVATPDDLNRSCCRRLTPHTSSVVSGSPHFTYTGVSPPICLTSTYVQPGTFTYSRHHNPTQNITQDQIGALYGLNSRETIYERLDSSSDSFIPPNRVLCFPSGMAAIATVMWTFIGPEDHLIVSDEVYGTVYGIAESLKSKCGVTTLGFNARNLDQLEELIRPNTRMIYLETSSNPSMKIPDFEHLQAIVEAENLRRREAMETQISSDPASLPELSFEKLQTLAKEKASMTNREFRGGDVEEEEELLGEEERKSAPATLKRLLLVVDNSYASPVLFNPFDYGAHIVVESGTKFLSGSSTVLQGHVACRSIMDHAHVMEWRVTMGYAVSPLTSFLISKGLDTLPIRMETICSSGLYLAKFLESLPFVSRVLYPGLPSHPDYRHCGKYFHGKGGGLIYLHLPISTKSASRMIQETKLVVNATSYGSSHFMWDLKPIELRSKVLEDQDEGGIEGCWLRLAVGLHPVEDVCADIAQAIARYTSFQIGTVDRAMARFVRYKPVTSRRHSPAWIRDSETRHMKAADDPTSLYAGDLVALTNEKREIFLFATVQLVGENQLTFREALSEDEVKKMTILVRMRNCRRESEF